jgi:hypothetical protein
MLPAAYVLLMFSGMTVTMDRVSHAVDEAFPEAPDHPHLRHRTLHGVDGNIWKFTLREKEWA